MVVRAMVEKRDRLTLSQDLEVIADRIAQSGQTGRAVELKVVAAHLRAKAARTDDAVAEPTPRSHVVDEPARRAYLLGIALLVSWLAVVLLVVLLLG
jgi:hypothetical protein